MNSKVIVTYSKSRQEFNINAKLDKRKEYFVNELINRLSIRKVLLSKLEN